MEISVSVDFLINIMPGCNQNGCLRNNYRSVFISLNGSISTEILKRRKTPEYGHTALGNNDDNDDDDNKNDNGYFQTPILKSCKRFTRS